jgi:dihydroorotate dehydrogenase electron transfer subunit
LLNLMVKTPIEPGLMAEKPQIADTIATTISNRPAGDGYRCLVARADAIAAAALPGQFFNIQCPSDRADQPLLRRPMSIYRADRTKYEIEFLYKIKGRGTRTLSRLEPGVEFRIFGPLGNGFSMPRSTRHIVVLGRGVGLATLAPLAELASEASVGVTAILSARSLDHVLSVERFSKIGAAIEIVVDSDQSSNLHNIERILRGVVQRETNVAFYTCGSNRLLLLMQELGRELNVSGQVALEQQMACGIGMCFTCVRHFRASEGLRLLRVCCDGPVFNLDVALQWQ